MFRPDGLREPCIVGAQFGLQGLSADGVVLLDSLEPCMLRAIQLEIAMEQVVQLIFDRAHRNHIDAADDDTRDRRGKVSRTRSRPRRSRIIARSAASKERARAARRRAMPQHLPNALAPPSRRCR
jgi:hypothetical protein